jgi:ubiquinone/menaquinone biosynthesis C-methylase UbiE
MNTNIPYTLDEIEKIDRRWTNTVAAKTGCDEWDHKEPVDDITQFFNHIAGKKILDVGCGSGNYVWRFLEQGLEYHGLDHSSEMLRIARRNNPKALFIESTFRQIPFPDKHFDGLWNCCSLSGIPKMHVLGVLGEQVRVLRPGTPVMFVMPMAPVHEKMYTDDQGKPKLYQAYYSLREFGNYVAEAGLSIVKANNRWSSSYFSILATRPL